MPPDRPTSGPTPRSPATPVLTAVLEAVDPDAVVRFLSDELGFVIERVSPADAPVEFTMSGLGGRVAVRRSSGDGPARLVVDHADPALVARGPLRAPNGTVIEAREDRRVPIVPPARPSLSIVRAGDDAAEGIGRAGMIYRDLLPDRWGGRFIASHIRIPDGGDVPDWVHYHRIRFQMIYCAAGWVEVVYEDQGPPFRLEAGDCVLQPPEIRHRVLRSSPGLEVIEVGCPAVHDTLADHTMTLPTSAVSTDRDFGGQRFVRHRAAGAATGTWLQSGLVSRDTGIGAATDGVAGVSVVSAGRGVDAVPSERLTHDGEIVLDVVLAGSAGLSISGTSGADDGDGGTYALAHRDAVAIPPGARWRWSGCSDDFEFVEVALPADAVGRAAGGG